MVENRAPKKNVLSRVSISGWVAVVLGIIAIVFIAQNHGSATVDFFWISVRAPLWFTLLIVFVVGWVVGALMMRGRTKRQAAAAAQP